MTQFVKGPATRLLLGAALVLGQASLFAAVQPAFSQESGHGGSDAASSHGRGKQGSGHGSGESHESSTEHSSSEHGSAGHESGGKKGGKGAKGGRKGGAGDHARGNAGSGIVGHVFEQQEDSHGSDASKGPHPGGNPAEKSGESHDHDSGEHETSPQ